MTTRNDPWYKTAFGALYPVLYAHRDNADARRAVDFIETVLGSHLHKRWLDLCCGAGRHMMELSRRGYHVIGLDLSDTLLERAVGERVSGRESPLLVRGSMNALPFLNAFDVVINLFTSFGYFSDDEANANVFREVSRALLPGGMFVLDFLNAPQVRCELEAETHDSLPDGRRVITRRQINESTLRVEKTVEIISDTESWWFEESVRLYTVHELEAMLCRSELIPIKRFGDFDGSAYNEFSPRCILLAKKR